MAIRKADAAAVGTKARGPKGMQAVRLDLSPEDHQELRIFAAEQGVAMATMARALVVAALAARRGRKRD